MFAACNTYSWNTNTDGTAFDGWLFMQRSSSFWFPCRGQRSTALQVHPLHRLCSSACWTQAAWRVRGCRCRGRALGSSSWPGSSRTAAGGRRRACRRRRKTAGSNGRAPSFCEKAGTRRHAPPRTVTSSWRCLGQERGDKTEITCGPEATAFLYWDSTGERLWIASMPDSSG